MSDPTCLILDWLSDCLEHEDVVKDGKLSHHKNSCLFGFKPTKTLTKPKTLSLLDTSIHANLNKTKIP